MKLREKYIEKRVDNFVLNVDKRDFYIFIIYLLLKYNEKNKTGNNIFDTLEELKSFKIYYFKKGV